MVQLIVKDINMNTIVNEKIELPDWATHLTFENGILTAWDNDPQWKNGEFYPDPFFEFEDLHAVKEVNFYIPNAHKAVRDITNSSGFVFFFVEING